VKNRHDSGPGSLRAAVEYANANAKTTITFAARLRGTIKLTSGELAITQSMIIDGPGRQLVVSGSGLSRVFAIGPGAVVTISGLTIAGGLADSKAPGVHGLGGGILNQGHLTLKDTLVSRNQAVGAANDRISLCGYQLSGVGAGGGVANVRTLNVSDSTFEENQVLGASKSSSDSNAKGNTFPGVAFGGGLANVGGVATATVTNCHFTDNLARAGDQCIGTGPTNSDIAGDAGGGAIANFGFGPSALAKLDVSLSHFRNNKAIGGNDNISPVLPGHSFGGAIASHKLFKGALKSANLIVSGGCIFGGNRAVGGNYNVVTPGAPVGDLRGIPNMAAAGGVFASGTGTVSDSYFDGNQAIGGQGGDPGTTGLPITKNGGDARGGGIGVAFPDTEVTVSNCTVKGSLARGGRAGAVGSGGNAWGGGLGNTATGPMLKVTGNSKIKSNVARGGSGDSSGPPSNGGDGLGGGVYNAPGSTTNVTAGTITANRATGAKGKLGGSDGRGIGGGLYNLGTSTFDPKTITKNHASTSHDNVYP
jgi:hypothetical protein